MKDYLKAVSPFEMFLEREIFALQYKGIKDDQENDRMSQAFDKWYSELDVSDVIEYANQFGKYLMFLSQNKVNVHKGKYHIEILGK